MDSIIGSMTALITPFKNGKVDLEKYETLIKRQIANGIDVVSPVGTTGEKNEIEEISYHVTICSYADISFRMQHIQ